MPLAWIRQSEADYVSRSVVLYVWSLPWLHSLIMETTQLRTVYGTDTLGCHEHCSAPRYLKGTMVNPGGKQ